MVHTFSVLSLQLKKTPVTQQVSPRPMISNANVACAHKEVRRSTGHIMVTTRYSDQQGSKSLQKVMRLYKQWHRPKTHVRHSSRRLLDTAKTPTEKNLVRRKCRPNLGGVHIYMYGHVGTIPLVWFVNSGSGGDLIDAHGSRDVPISPDAVGRRKEWARE